MNINFQSKNLDLFQDTKNMMANRMYGLNKFFPQDTSAFIDVQRTTNHHNNGPDIYYVSIKIDDPHNQYFTEEYQDTIKKAFNGAYGDMFRVVRSHRSKSRNLARRAGAQIKRIFRKGK